MPETDISSSAALPHAVICDMDGLLLDTERLSAASFAAVAALHHVPEPDFIFPQLIGRSRHDHLQIFTRHLPPGLDPLAFDTAWKAAFQDMLADHVPVKPGAEAMLAYLKDRDVPLGLATSSAHDKALTYLERAGLLPYFDALVGGDEIRASKPAPDIYREAVHRLGVTPAAALAFEDSDNGVRSAHAAGIPVVQIPDLAVPSPEVLALGHMTATSLADAAAKLDWPGFPGIDGLLGIDKGANAPR